MYIGVPKEIKQGECRVGLKPDDVRLLTDMGNHVVVQIGAGRGSDFSDQDYWDAGARIVGSSDSVWNRSELIVKVKEPLECEWGYIKENHKIFTFFHFASNRKLIEEMMKRKATCIAYETLTYKHGLPILSSMSKIAGEIAIYEGMRCLQRRNNIGVGILPKDAVVSVIGIGEAGLSAVKLADSMGARVNVYDIDERKYKKIPFTCNAGIILWEHIDDVLAQSDLVIGCVHRRGEKAAYVISEQCIKGMRDDSVVVDISIDQGGCFATSRPTTHQNPTFKKHGVIHYCVPNIPAIVPKTATKALTKASMPYVINLVNKVDWFKYFKSLNAINISSGEILNKAVNEFYYKGE